MAEILVKEYRGDVVENVHYGSIAIVSSTGETIAYTGDIERQTYMRSASKPIQVLPTLLAGLHKKYNLNEEEVTICNSSHWGSNHHIYVLQSIMENIHEQCVKYGKQEDGYINYVKGANVAGFMKVAKAMMAQGILQVIEN